MNQERGLQRPGDTRWDSHFKTLENFLIIFSSIVNVFKYMQQDNLLSLDRFAAKNLLGNIQEFEFVFVLHLMFKILLLTNELNKALQKKDREIVNAMRLLELTKIRLQTMRESELESLMNEVYSFCGKHEIMIPEMDEDYPRSKGKRSEVSYSHNFSVGVFYVVIDLQLHKLNSRFDVVTSDLLLGMACLNLVDSFANFEKDRIKKLAKYYPSELMTTSFEISAFSFDSFIVYARMPDSKFINFKGMKDLAIVMAETKLD